MADVIYYTLLAMIGVYIAWLITSNFIKRNFRFKICAICATVASTWTGLIILKLSGLEIPQVIVAILMGQSIVGFMYFLERRADSTKNNKLLIMKPFVILFGTLFVYWIILGVYS